MDVPIWSLLLPLLPTVWLALLLRRRKQLERELEARVGKESGERQMLHQRLEAAYREIELKVRDRTSDMQSILGRLEGSNALLSATFESMQSGLLVAEEGKPTVLVNRSFLRIWRLDDDSDASFPAERNCRHLYSRLYELVEEPDLLCRELEDIGHRSGGGRDRLLRLRDHRLLEYHREPFSAGEDRSGLLHLFRDVTAAQRAHNERQRTLRELELFKRALDAHALISISDPAGIITYVNDALCQVSGYGRDELIGSNHRMLKSDHHDNAFFRNLWMTISAGRLWRAEICNRAKDGKHYWVDTTIVPFTDEKGRPFQYLAMRSPIDERKEAEANLVEAKNAAEAATRAKSEFLANISHEIRTPMNAILGFSELLASELEDPRHKEYLKLLSSSGYTLLELINDLLDLSRIESGSFRLEPGPVSLRDLLQEIQGIFSFKAREKGIDLDHECEEGVPDFVLTDEVRLRQVLYNLVGNAIKFTSEGGVTFRALAQGQGGEANRTRLALIVEDTGIGIPEAERERVFEAFQQGSARQGIRYGGTGLGLAITRRLIELLGGTIELSSRDGEGSRFTVSLELERLSGQRGGAPDLAISLPRYREVRAMVVDDDVANRQVFSNWLYASGIDVDEASDAESARRRLRELRPDIILMDVMMPGINGLDFARELRSQEVFRGIPILFVTAMPSSQLESMALADFSEGCLSKPVRRATLMQEIARLLPADRVAQPTVSVPGSRSEELDLSSPQARDVEALVEHLEAFTHPRWEALQKRMNADALIEFAEELLTLGGNHDCELLLDLGASLRGQVEVFDIRSIRRTLEHFPALLASLRALQAGQN